MKTKRNEVIYILLMIVFGYIACILNLKLYLYLFIDNNVSERVLFQKTLYWLNICFILFNIVNLIFYLFQKYTKVNEYIVPLVMIIYFILLFCLLYIVGVSQEFDRKVALYQNFIWMFLIQIGLICYMTYINLTDLKKSKKVLYLLVCFVSCIILYISLSLLCMLDGKQITVYANNSVFFITEKNFTFQQNFLIMYFVILAFVSFLRRR
ncbi:putative membrane protein [Francisella tularensis subsp. novicida]|nr:putative membrane protein [Francisella tularensis subsp. novicida]